MQRDEFREQVREALAHLHDLPYLETHPLARLLASQQPGAVRGKVLQHILLDAIQALKPQDDLPYESLVWRKYRYLYLRYVQALTIPEITSDLGISPRQSRRYALEAVAAVAQVLHDRYPALRASDGLTAPGNRPTDPEKTAVPTDGAPALPALVREIERVETSADEHATSVPETLDSVVDTIGPLAVRHGVTLRRAAAPPALTVAVDRTVLRQGLLSILGVTIEHAVGTVELAARESADGTDVAIDVRSSVADSSRVHRLVHDERWQVARHLLGTYGGTVTVDVAPHHLLCVTVRVPSVQRHRVLIVEDNPDAIQLYRRYLAGTPYHVLAATSSADARDRAESERPDIIVLDVMMPGHDGWEILQLLKSQPETRHIPVIVCSVLKERELALALGAADVLVKPISRSELLQALARQGMG
ncbi:MAG TPA: response regulator [Chloroflexota bacterium]|nr:response regulator [Chloroflexota bacterium]